MIRYLNFVVLCAMLSCISGCGAPTQSTRPSLDPQEEKLRITELLNSNSRDSGRHSQPVPERDTVIKLAQSRPVEDWIPLEFVAQEPTDEAAECFRAEAERFPGATLTWQLAQNLISNDSEKHVWKIGVNDGREFPRTYVLLSEPCSPLYVHIRSQSAIKLLQPQNENRPLFVYATPNFIPKFDIYGDADGSSLLVLGVNRLEYTTPLVWKTSTTSERLCQADRETVRRLNERRHSSAGIKSILSIRECIDTDTELALERLALEVGMVDTDQLFVPYMGGFDRQNGPMRTRTYKADEPGIVPEHASFSDFNLDN